MHTFSFSYTVLLLVVSVVYSALDVYFLRCIRNQSTGAPALGSVSVLRT